MSRAKLLDLAFLDTVFPQLDRLESNRYTKAHWLVTDFASDVWDCRFGARRVVIDWNIPIGSSGQMLTDPGQASLLLTLRSWLILSSHADVQRGAIWSPATEFYRLSITVDWIDYVLARADKLAIATQGLAGLSRDELTGALFTIANNRWKSDGIYEYGSRLGDHLRGLGRKLSPRRLRQLVAEHPFLATDIPRAEDRVTDLTDKEVIAARAALWDLGLYASRGGDGTCEWFVPLSNLVPRLCPGTIRGSRGKRMPIELNLIPDDRATREFAAVPVTRASGAGLSKHRFSQYQRCIREFGLLSNVGLSVPIASLRTLQAEDAIDTSSLKDSGRFRTPPPDTVFFALRRAIELVLTTGDSIVDAYLAVIGEAAESNVPIGRVLNDDCGDSVLRPLGELGISRWTIRDISALPWRGPGISGAEYYARLRANVGLWDLLRVLYGAVQVVVGALTARRVSELMHLDAETCIDASRSYLVFGNAKSGVAGHRETLARPIPPIAVRSIGLIQRLQRTMLDTGHISEQGSLFAPPCPRRIAVVQTTQAIYTSNLDLFFDYIEMPKDEERRRYYLRQHQLRRFFAMVFFWSNSFGGLETLREFLGHTDANHLYRYITETTPGDVLRGVKAEWAVQALRTQISAAEALADVVERRYGTREFKLLDSEDLSDYIENLLETGKVQIEPEFLDSRGGYRIAVRLLSTEVTA